MTVSVIIPARNNAPFVRSAIESALADDLEDLEVIVMENASTDATVEVARSVADSRVRVIHTADPVGIAENWTRATAEASGDFIRLLCADDLIEPGSLRRQRDLLVAEPGAVAVTGPRRIIDDADRVIFSRFGGRGLRRRQGGRVALRTALCAGANVFGEPSAVLFRADPLKRCLPWSSRFPYVLDLEMYTRVFQFGDVIFDPAVASSFRVHARSLSVDIGRRQSDDFLGWADWAIAAGLVDERRGDRIRCYAAARLNRVARGLVYRFRVREGGEPSS